MSTYRVLLDIGYYGDDEDNICYRDQYLQMFGLTEREYRKEPPIPLPWTTVLNMITEENPHHEAHSGLINLMYDIKRNPGDINEELLNWLVDYLYEDIFASVFARWKNLVDFRSDEFFNLYGKQAISSFIYDLCEYLSIVIEIAYPIEVVIEYDLSAYIIMHADNCGETLILDYYFPERKDFNFFMELLDEY